MFIIVDAPNMSGGPYVIKRLDTEEPAFRITGHELKRFNREATGENVNIKMDFPWTTRRNRGNRRDRRGSRRN